MERLTIEEAINHAKEVAKEKYNKGFLCHANPDDGKLNQCIECAKEHEQLAEWLEELKAYKESEEEGAVVKSPYKPGDYVYCAEKYIRGYGVCAYKYLAKVKGYIVVYVPNVSIDENIDESLAEMCKEAEKKAEELNSNGQNT